jgi:LysR family transcriptional regulator, low CO2-responsive transcriptional regulator
MDLRNLRAFYFVGKYGSLLRAAAYLKLSSPAISVQLKKLENDLGVQLFERHPNKLILTRKGEALLNETARVFDALTRLQEVASQGASLPSGKLTIAVGSDLPKYFAPRIAAFSHKHPGLRITILSRHAGEALPLLTDGTVDVAIGWFSKVPPGIQKVSLLNSKIRLVFPSDHPLSGKRNLSLAAVANFRLILHTGTTPTRRLVESAFHKSAIEIDNILEVGTCESIIEYVQLGLGVGFVHDMCLPHQRGKISSSDMRREFDTMEVFLVHKKSAASNAWHQSLIDALR